VNDPRDASSHRGGTRYPAGAEERVPSGGLNGRGKPNREHVDRLNGVLDGGEVFVDFG
jgi:hypothetical protein